MKIYLLRDKVAEQNASPFAAENDATAARMMKVVRLPPSSNPEDFALLCIGEYDHLTVQDSKTTYEVPVELGVRHEAPIN